MTDIIPPPRDSLPQTNLTSPVVEKKNAQGKEWSVLSVIWFVISYPFVQIAAAVSFVCEKIFACFITPSDAQIIRVDRKISPGQESPKVQALTLSALPSNNKLIATSMPLNSVPSKGSGSVTQSAQGKENTTLLSPSTLPSPPNKSQVAAKKAAPQAQNKIQKNKSLSSDKADESLGLVELFKEEAPLPFTGKDALKIEVQKTTVTPVPPSMLGKSTDSVDKLTTAMQKLTLSSSLPKVQGLSQSRVAESPPIIRSGIQNGGNSCYLNSIFQALKCFPGFKSFLEITTEQPSKAFFDSSNYVKFLSFHFEGGRLPHYTDKEKKEITQYLKIVLLEILHTLGDGKKNQVSRDQINYFRDLLVTLIPTNFGRSTQEDAQECCVKMLELFEFPPFSFAKKVDHSARAENPNLEFRVVALDRRIESQTLIMPDIDNAKDGVSLEELLTKRAYKEEIEPHRIETEAQQITINGKVYSMSKEARDQYKKR